MCKVGDIIIVYNAKNGRPIGPHPFVVLDDTGGVISGMYQYDFIALIMTSYQSEDEKRREKLAAYSTNFHIAAEDKVLNDPTEDDRNSFVRVNDLFFFDKSKTKYKEFGRLDEDIFNLLLEFIAELAANGSTFNRLYDKAKRIPNSND